MVQPDANPAETLSRAEVLAVLSRIGIRDGQADEIVADIEFPASKTEVYQHLLPHGLNRDVLISELGGSP